MSSMRPKFLELPLDSSHPPHSAWGLYGPDDELGTLNLLTPERTVAAAKEIRTGVRIGLNWSLEQMKTTGGFREVMKHEIFQIAPNMNDDRIEFNTQTSTQWDGLRHWGFDDGRFYNGLTQAEILSGKTSKLGIHAWQQGIVGRGVLVDFLSYARKHNIPYNPLEHHAIPLQMVLTILADANVALREGDILLLRTGFTHAFASSSPAIQASIMAKRPFEYPGIESNTKVLEWLWDTGIAAVAGDCPGFEAWPPSEEAMHQVLLAGFGMPIGELFDFEGLAEECGREGRWTFFFSSEPLNVKGGVGSPPNALAIF